MNAKLIAVLAALFHLITVDTLKSAYSKKPWFIVSVLTLVALGTISSLDWAKTKLFPSERDPIFVMPREPVTGRPGKTEPDPLQSVNLWQAIDLAVPPETGGDFNLLERNHAKSALLSGQPHAFGPSLFGLQLGMPFETAEAKVLGYFPDAEVVRSLSQFPVKLGRGDASALTAFIDITQGVSVVLAKHPDAPAVAGIWYRFSTGPQSLGAPRINAALRHAFRDAKTLTFGQFSDQIELTLLPKWIEGDASGLCVNAVWYVPSDVWAFQRTPLPAEVVEENTRSFAYNYTDHTIDPSQCAGNLMVSGTTSPHHLTIQYSLFDEPFLLAVAN